MGENIKIEFAETVCHGCLASGRFITHLGPLSDLFCLLSNLPATDILLCWECKSILKRTLEFQHRIQHAQYLLQEAAFHLKKRETCSLSTLGTFVNDNFGIGYEESCKEETEFTELKIEREPSIHMEEDFNESYNDEAYDDEEYQNINNIEDIKAENTKIEENNVKDSESNGIVRKDKSKYTTKTIKGRRKCLKHAMVIKSNFKTMDCCVVVCLSEFVLEKMLDHKFSHMNSNQTRDKCKVCDFKFEEAIDLRRHNVLKHPPPIGPFECSECNSQYPSYSDLKAHWSDHELYKCKLCIGYFSSKDEFERHIRLTHSFTYKCVHCDASFNTNQAFVKHYKELHDRFICDHCGKTFEKKKTLETHIIRHHLPPICKICERVYKNSHALETHGRNIHPELYYDTSKTELSYCVECNKQFKSVFAYKRHLSTAFVHRPPKPVRIPCPDCGKIFSRKVYMNNHYRLIHAKKSRHHCEICNKYFATAYGLRNHKQRIHEKTLPPKDKICDICGRGFSANRILINHRRTHTGERPFKCSQCPAAFAQKTAKTSHERSQHKIM